MIALREPSQKQCAKGKVCRLCFLWAPLLLGSTWQEKVADIRSQMQKHRKGPTAVLLSALDETACEYGLVDTGRAPGPPQPPCLLGPAALDSFPNHLITMGSVKSTAMAFGN